MKIEEISSLLDKLKLETFLIDNVYDELQAIKEIFVKEGDEQKAKLIWIYQKIFEIHKLYRHCFKLLKNKDYYKAWCLLEQIEIAFKNLKRHFSFDREIYFLWHIEKSVRNLQVLFPYQLFGSSELLKKEKRCSVCDEKISIRNPCGHIIGEIYRGEICHRIVTKCEVIGLSLVENPGNKYSVMFLKDEKTDEQKDQYNYDTIDYLFSTINSPYEFWNLEISEREITKESYKNIGRNEPCLCNSGKKFKKCCLLKVGEKYPHYEFIVTNPSQVVLLTNTVKSKFNDFN